jgi:hypothetical protein
MNVQHFSQEPQDSDVRKQTCAGGDMILDHPFKIFNSALFPPIMPGPEIIQHEIIYHRKFNSYKAGEKIIYLEDFGEEPQKEHVDQKPRSPHQAELKETPYFFFLNNRINFQAQILLIHVYLSPFPPLHKYGEGEKGGEVED